jgi:predicted enzyme related to lactoylglutathione lyase
MRALPITIGSDETVESEMYQRILASFGASRQLRRVSSDRGAVGSAWLLAGWLALLSAGCATQPPERLPAITDAPVADVQVGKFVWFDLLTDDAETARDFYGRLFEWDMAPLQDDPAYTLIRLGGVSIGGIAAYPEGEVPEGDVEEFPAVWLVSLSVADVERAVETVTNKGGEVIYGPLDAGARGRLAAIRDPGGAELVVLRAPGGDPADRARRAGDWAWVDLFTRDPTAAVDFYTALAGYDIREMSKGDPVTRVLVQARKPRGGIVTSPWAGVEPNWLPYVWVEDLDAVIARAEDLGGRLVLRVDDVAVLADPSGAAIGVQQLSARS